MPVPPVSRKLLLPVDGSIHAERAAHYLARLVGALGATETIVLYVHPAESVPTRAADGTEIAFDVHDVGLGITQKVRELLDNGNVPYRFDAVLGDAADVIARVAEEERVDDTVMGSRGLSTWQGLVVGSVTHKVIHRVAVPVTIVGTPTQGEPPVAGIDRILLAVDGSTHAVNAASYVCNLAASGLPLEVEVLNVPTPIPQGILGAFIGSEIIDNYYGEASVPVLRDACAALISARIKFDTHVKPGNAAEQIVRVAQERGCSHIVMGTRGHSALGGLALGSVAYQVLHLSPVPVTLVK